ncbi:uncharacterized protein LOC143864053 [Tasmannia lanceolata]|uniref:uncharacterized protein LOC143864053 n=1 Tax=Tasmannia lanceolata TaxID=3420 RepID=UPI004063399C
MRIRKRFPLTSYLPSYTSLSLQQRDQERRTHGLHQKRDLEIHHERSKEKDKKNPSVNLQKMMIRKRRNACIITDSETKKQACMVPHVSQVEALKGKGKEKVDAGKSSKSIGSSSGAKAGSGLKLVSPSPHQVVGTWGESEKAFPLKKRRGSLGWGQGGKEKEEEKIINKEIKAIEKEKAIKLKTRVQKKKKILEEGEIDSEEDENEEEETESDEVVCVRAKKKLVKRAKRSTDNGDLMEGSRCSRVNGRGWRCCQQTLVGYSLCEHHLGKGRVRSMSSVRGPDSTITTSNKNKDKDNSRIVEKKNVVIEVKDEEEGEQEKLITKKRTKIGMVKARSINSLIDLNKPYNSEFSP